MCAHKNRSAVLVTIACLCIGVAPTQAQESRPRFYLGVGIGTVKYSGNSESITFTDQPSTIQMYGGFRFSDQWSIEIAQLSLSEAESGTIQGSGTQQLRLTDSIDSTSISAVRQISLSDAFQWKPNINLLGTLGVSSSRKQAGKLVVSTNEYTQTESEEAGLAAGFGVLYSRRHFAIRGSLQWLDLLDNGGMTNFGVSSEFGF